MSTLQIEIPASGVSIGEERQSAISEVSSSPRTLQARGLHPLPSCRVSAPTSVAESASKAFTKIPPLATAFLEDLRDSIVALDAHGHCLFVNRAFETLTGFSRSELLGTLLCHKVVTGQSFWPALECV
jgi:PAS domain-containing protein